MTTATISPGGGARVRRGGSVKHGLGHRLASGEVSYDFIGRRKRWFLISGAIIVVALAALLIRGLNLGIDFKGGSTYEPKSNGHSVSQVQSALSSAGVNDAEVQTIGEGMFRITTKVQTTAQVNTTEQALVKLLGVTEDGTNPSTVGPTWGSQITHKALEGLIIFLILVALGLALRFEPKMAAAALAALLHDMMITVGIYALVGFEVTPATVVAFLTILGFSLYDTVVVFDRVRETTAGLQSGAKMTYSQAANLALNQTLMRSINTSFIALVPVASLLFVGAGLLGAGTLKDLALAQFIGLAAGAYSSIFIATPLLVQLKEREPGMQALSAKVARAAAAGKVVGTGRRPVTAQSGSAAVSAAGAAGSSAPVVTDAPDPDPDAADAGAGAANDAVVLSQPPRRPGSGPSTGSHRIDPRARPARKKKRR